MKQLLVFALLFTACTAYAQDLKKAFAKIKTREQAEAFVAANPQLEAALEEAVDTAFAEKGLFGHKAGYIFDFFDFTGKIIEMKKQTLMRASYIYLDGTKLSKPAIDSTRKVILEKYKSGTPFMELAQQYNMDGNTTGSLNWFGPGMMAPEFEQAVQKHQKGDIFTIDIPANNWYYVTLKTHDDRDIKTLLLLFAKEK